MKTILVGADLTTRSERALRRALRLADGFGATVTVLHTVDPTLPDAMRDKVTALAREELERLCASIGGPAATIEIEAADIVETIHARAEAIGADLIVLGTHKPRPVWDMIRGTTMERIVRASHVPVLVVRDAVDHDYSRVLCGIDLSPSARGAARVSARLAPGADFRAFHAFHVPYRGNRGTGSEADLVKLFHREAQAELEAWWITAGIPEGYACPEPVAGGVVRVFEEARDAFRPDLVAIGTHGRPTLFGAHLGSFTQAMMQETTPDLLVVRR